jgi:tRNA(Arg) A34 adenosine deaminase TadA
MKKKYCITAIIKDRHGHILSRASNSYIKTHPLQAKYAKKVGREKKIYLHAEVLAILRAGKKIKKAFSIEIFRFDEKGNTKLAKPCPICTELIKTTPIKEIIYTEDFKTKF